jgi:hypothetical protein
MKASGQRFSTFHAHRSAAQMEHQLWKTARFYWVIIDAVVVSLLLLGIAMAHGVLQRMIFLTVLGRYSADRALPQARNLGSVIMDQVPESARLARMLAALFSAPAFFHIDEEHAGLIGRVMHRGFQAGDSRASLVLYLGMEKGMVLSLSVIGGVCACRVLRMPVWAEWSR